MLTTAHELFERVREHFSGAQGHFVVSRLQLKSGLLMANLRPGDQDPDKATRLLNAIREVCPHVLTQGSPE